MQFNKSSFNFLQEIKKNNNREWFAENKPTFKIAQENAKSFFEKVTLNLEKHDSIEKFKLFRIYRDVRFSKDKTPYQSHFAASFTRLGKELRGTYYLRVKPGETFLAGGFWQPEKEDLIRIRQEINIDSSEIRAILEDKKFIQYFGNKFGGEELKSAPRGFDKNHKSIDLLRKKGFIATRNFTDKEVLSDNFSTEVEKSFIALKPFFDLFSNILTTDLNGESIV